MAARAEARYGALTLRVPNGHYYVVESTLASRRALTCVLPYGMSVPEAREAATELRSLLDVLDKWGSDNGSAG